MSRSKVLSLKRRVSSESIIIEVRRAINWGGASALALFEILGSAVKIGENRNPDEGSNRFISVVCLIPFLRFYLFIIQFGPFVGVSFFFKSIAKFILGFAVVAIRSLVT